MRNTVGVTIVAIDPPFAVEHGVLFGLQSTREVDEPVPAWRTTEFQTMVDVVRTGRSDVDFTGTHVHGRRGDRFVYISWGLPDQTEPFVMFARAKIKLANVPGELIELAVHEGVVLIAEIQATNSRGQPASGTIKRPEILWRTGSSAPPTRMGEP